MMSRGALAFFSALLIFNVTADSAEVHALPHQCETVDMTKTGRPMMFAPLNGVAMGISVPRTVFHAGEPISIYVWVNNPTDREQVLWSCSLWYQWGVDVYDSKRHRIPTRQESQPKTSDGSKLQGDRFAAFTRLTHPPKLCFRDVPLSIPPEYCGLLRDVRDVTIELSNKYDLRPGSYLITEKNQNPEQGGISIIIVDKSDSRK